MSKRLKAVDLPHYSPSLARMPSRAGFSSLQSKSALFDRPRTPRVQNFARYFRHGQRYLKPQQTEFRIRTSVADLVMKELDDYERCIFYQRVYILAKNVLLTATPESSAASILSQYMHSKTSLNVDTKTEEASGEDRVGEEEANGDNQEVFDGEGEGESTNIDEASQALTRTDLDTGYPELQTVDPKSSREGPLLQLTKADFESKSLKEKRVQEVDFFEQFRDKVEYIVKKCDAEQLSEDRFTGLMLCMGNSHTLLVLEGTEDTIAYFCQELLLISESFFEVIRIFLVEDRIEETFFDDFLYRRAVAMNINEKFPPPTANDPQLMGSQHWLIKEKLLTICRTLSQELRPQEAELLESRMQSAIQIKEEEKEPRKKRSFKPKRKKTPKPSKSPMSEEKTTVEKALEGSPSQQSSNVSEHLVENAEPDDEPDVEEPLEMEEGPTTIIAVEATKIDDVDVRKEPSFIKTLKISGDASEEPLPPEENEEEDFMPEEFTSPFSLSPAIYNRLLPEIQRIDLVLTSKRFYLDVPEFLRFSQEIPMQQDEDALIWPTSFTYLPLNVFDRQPFDVNLTFGNYDEKEADGDESDSSGEEGKEGEEEEAKGEKKDEKDS